jgi:hypothetical protein
MSSAGRRPRTDSWDRAQTLSRSSRLLSRCLSYSEITIGSIEIYMRASKHTTSVRDLQLSFKNISCDFSLSVGTVIHTHCTKTLPCSDSPRSLLSSQSLSTDIAVTNQHVQRQLKSHQPRRFNRCPQTNTASAKVEYRRYDALLPQPAVRARH